MILSFFANQKSSSYSYKTEKCIWFNWIVQPGIMKNIFLSIKAWEDEESFLTLLAVHFFPHQPIFIRCQQRDTNVTYYFTCHLPQSFSQKCKRNITVRSILSNRLWSRFSSLSCIHVRMNVIVNMYNSMPYAGATMQIPIC